MRPKPQRIRQMRKQLVLNKERLRGLYGKLILRLLEVNRQGKYIEWSNIYEKIGRGFSIKKEEIREIMFMLQDIGICDISCKGIKLNFEVENGK